MSLDLSGGVAIGRLIPGASAHLLPRLTKLIANPEYLVHFLQPKGAFPLLQSLTITSKRSSENRLLDDVLDCVKHRITKEFELCLRTEDGMEKWLLSGHRAKPAKNIV